MAIVTNIGSQSIVVGLVISTSAWLIHWIFVKVAAWYEKLNPPCNLPVLNLRGWHFDQAQREYLDNLDKYLDIGREKVQQQHLLSRR